MLPKIIANFSTSLSSKLSPGDTSLVVNSIGSKHGDLTDGLYLITLSEGESNEEHILGTLDADTLTFSSLTRDISVIDGVTSQSTGKIHRRGSEVKITNFLLVLIARALNGDTPLSANAPIRYNSDFAFSNDRDLVDKQYVLSVVTGGSVTFDQHVLSGTAGESLTIRDLVYFKESDQKWWKCDADTAATVEGVKLGIVLSTTSADAAITGGVLIFGVVEGFTGLTPGAKQYAGNTAGAIVETPGTTDVFIGWAYDDETIIFYPREIAALTDSTLAALAGGGDFGTPSASNKFVTEEFLVGGTPSPIQNIYTTSDTWTKPAGLKYITVKVQGAGGAGGGGGATNNSRGSGGGAGGYSEKIIDAGDLSSTEAVTVAQVASGTTTSFGSHCSANRGSAGNTATSGIVAPGAGGTATGGDVNVTGNTGLPAVTYDASTYTSGRGASSKFGDGGGEKTGTGAGSAATGYGSGGGGGWGFDSNPQNGGNPAGGLVIVIEHYS